MNHNDLFKKMIMKDRRGAVGYLIRLIIAVVLVIAVALLAWKVGGLLTNFGTEQECQAVLTTGGVMQYFNPNAPIRATKPSQQFDSDISLCPVNTIRYKERSNHDMIIEDIANEMISCYKKYGKGEVNLFEQNPGRNIYCIMCTYITFDDIPGPIDGLFEYMDDTEIRGLGITYTEFLMGGKPPTGTGGASITAAGEEYMLDTDKQYAVYYVYSKTKHYWDSRLGNHIKAGTYGGAIGAAGGIILTVATGGTWIVIVPMMAVGGVAAGTVLTPDAVQDDFRGAVMITEYDANIIRQFQCTDIGARTG